MRALTLVEDMCSMQVCWTRGTPKLAGTPCRLLCPALFPEFMLIVMVAPHQGFAPRSAA